MPELPDVEVYRRRLQRDAVGRTVSQVQISVPELLEGSSPQGLGQRLDGKRLTAVRRHGKDGARFTGSGGPVERIAVCGRKAFYCPGRQGRTP